MTSAIRLVLGVSVLAFAVGSAGCSSSGSTSPTVVPGGGTGSGGTGSGTGGTGTGTGGTTSAAGVPLTPTNGWVDGASNDLKIQGAYFAYADPTTTTSLMSDVKSTAKVCMNGTAAKVVMPCTIMAPATDCYGTYWGAAIGLNLNQPNVTDPTTMMMMGGDPIPYDASAIKGFAFDIEAGLDGTSTIPLPSQFRFNIEDATTQYCTSGVKLGANSYAFSDVHAQCYLMTPGDPATKIQSGVVKISWQVVTNVTSTTPFDFCISNVRALQ